jgi:ribosomal protein S17E
LRCYQSCISEIKRESKIIFWQYEESNEPDYDEDKDQLEEEQEEETEEINQITNLVF